MHVQKAKTIGLKFYGNSHDVISLIAIGTEECTYLLDFLAIAKKDYSRIFIELFGKLLTNEKVKKVFLDSRFASDFLNYEYDITMSNVFDINVI